AGDAGADLAQVATLKERVEHLRSSATADTLAHLSTLFNQRFAQGKLIEPETDSAKFYLAQLTELDAAHPSTLQARTAFAARLVDEAAKALTAQDYPLARTSLDTARGAGR